MLARELKQLTLVVISSSLIACGGESQEKSEAKTKGLNQSSECVSAKTTALTMENPESTDFGDGSDGDFFLDLDETFELDKSVYNFTSIVLNSGSRLTLSSDLAASTEHVLLNSQAGCELHGGIEISDFVGSLTLKCGTRITMTGSYNHPDGDSHFSTPEDSLESSGNSSNITAATISSSSIDFSAAEFTTPTVSYIDGDFTQHDLTLVINEGSSTVTSVNLGDFPLEPEENTASENSAVINNDAEPEIDSEPEDASQISDSKASCAS